MANRTGKAGSRARSAVLAALVSAWCAGTAFAQTLPDTLVRVYQNNPQLNAERARLRATDENVPQALSGYRPQVSAGLPALLRAGDTLSRVGSFTDPGLDSAYATVDYGDGTHPQHLKLQDRQVPLRHKYHHRGRYHVVITVTDAGGATGSDAFTVTAGCDKRFQTCHDRFNNVVNFRGFPHIPGNDFVVSYPVQGQPGNDGKSRQSG